MQGGEGMEMGIERGIRGREGKNVKEGAAEARTAVVLRGRVKEMCGRDENRGVFEGGVVRTGSGRQSLLRS